MMFNKSGRVVGVVHYTDSGTHGHVLGGPGRACDVVFTAPRNVSVEITRPIVPPEPHNSVLAAMMRRFCDGTVSVRHGNETPTLMCHHVLFSMDSGSVR